MKLWKPPFENKPNYTPQEKSFKALAYYVAEIENKEELLKVFAQSKSSEAVTSVVFIPCELSRLTKTVSLRELYGEPVFTFKISAFDKRSVLEIWCRKIKFKDVKTWQIKNTLHASNAQRVNCEVFKRWWRKMWLCRYHYQLTAVRSSVDRILNWW